MGVVIRRALKRRRENRQSRQRFTVSKDDLINDVLHELEEIVADARVARDTFDRLSRNLDIPMGERDLYNTYRDRMNRIGSETEGITIEVSRFSEAARRRLGP